MRCQLNWVWNVGAWIPFAVLFRVLHHFGELGPDILVCEKGAEEVLSVKRAEVIVEYAEFVFWRVPRVCLVEAAQAGVSCQNCRGTLRTCLNEMWESSRNVYDGREIPFLIRWLQVASTGPVDRDGGLGIIPHIALALIQAVFRPNRQSRSGCDSDLSLCGSLDGRDFRLIGHLDADDGAKLTTFGKAADKTVAEDIGES